MENSDYLILMALTSAGTLAALVLVARRHEVARGLHAAARALPALLAEAARAVAEGFRAWHLATLALALVALVASLDGDGRWAVPLVLLVAAGVALLFARAWFREVLFLMALRDEDLPGRFDKPIWAFFLVALPPIGLLLLRAHRLAHWPEPAVKASRAAHAARELA